MRRFLKNPELIVLKAGLTALLAIELCKFIKFVVFN